MSLTFLWNIKYKWILLLLLKQTYRFYTNFCALGNVSVLKLVEKTKKNVSSPKMCVQLVTASVGIEKTKKISVEWFRLLA